MESKKILRVFIASPGGLEAERRAFAEEVKEYNRIECHGRDHQFKAVAWEEMLSSYGRPQAQISHELQTCDYFILVLHFRWGSPPSADPDHPYSSGSAEEWDLALKGLQDPEQSMRDVALYFKSVSPEQMADPGEQLQRVLTFRSKVEEEKEIFFQTFDQSEHFSTRVRELLARWSRKEEQGVTTRIQPQAITLSSAETGERVLLSTEPGLVADAWVAANEGRLVDAEVLFAKATTGVVDPWAVLSYGVFLDRIGSLVRAEALFERALEIAGDDRGAVAAAYGNLGLIYKTRGDLEQAESMHRKSLAINEKLRRKESIAIDYGNLGLIYQTRGDLDQAETMHRKSLAINEELGRKEGMASDYGNLGGIYQTRGDLEQAEAMLRKALAIEEELGRKEGMANNYGNLGVIYQTRGDLDQAESMYRESLAINEELGRKEGMANNYGNLGVIYQTRGDLEQAESMHRKSLAINEELGRKEGMASNYGNLGLVYRTRGDLEQAESMLRKALAIEEELGRKEGMASNYGNLGGIYQTRGDLEQAETMHRKSLAIEEELGRKEGMASDYGNLGVIYQTRGDLEQARASWERALLLFQEIGATPKVAIVAGWLEELD